MKEKILKMKEKILKIEPYEDITGHEEGYTITTDVQQIIVGMETYQDCCETTGFLVSNDNFKDFIGETILGIYITDEKLKSYDVEVTILNDSYECAYVDLENVLFINFEMESSCEILQFVAYNCHNGYYGHDAFIKTEKLTIKREL